MGTKTIGTLFTGGGGVDIGAMAAGLKPLWGIEWRKDVADVANANLGKHVMVADVLTCDPRDFPYVDVLHASPPCPNFSNANNNKGETENDKALASKVAEFITVLQPQIFTLENVMEYRNSASWRTIEDALHEAGYWVNAEIVNSADFGVPQTRKRMIVRAIRGGFVPYLPQPVAWVGWYAAIADLIDTLPASQFAPWQLEKLPEEVRTCGILSASNSNANSWRDNFREGEEPAFTVTQNNRFGSKALLNPFAISGIPGTFGTKITVIDHSEHRFTVTSSDYKHPTRSYIVNTRAFLVNETSSMEVRKEIEPAATQVSSNRNKNQKAYIVNTRELHGNESDSRYTTLDEKKPVYTIASSSSPSRHRALMDSGRVVAMTTRALARFQSFPDWYELPEKKTLAAYIIGNAVPPLMYQKIIEGLL